MTKPHKDRVNIEERDHGYSIRVGKNVPANSANLAYVHSPKSLPINNLFITDYTHQIQENTPGSINEKTVYPDKDFLLRGLDGKYRFPTSDIVITDEFSVPLNRQEKPEPLYYESELKGWFDATNAMVFDYAGGYIDTPIVKPKNYSEYMSPKPNHLLYLGGKIKITKLDGTPIEEDHHYKIKLIQQEGDGVPKNAYRVVIYTSFRGDKEGTYLVRYEKYTKEGSHIADYTEVLNAHPYFRKVEKQQIQDLAKSPKDGAIWRAALNNKEYAIEESKNGDYLVYAPSQLIVADEGDARPADQFSYRVTSQLNNKFSNDNPGVLRIGIAYLNNGIPNVENLTGVIKKLNESEWKPKYLTLENPHPPEGFSIKSAPNYWSVDLSMHVDLLKNYDLIYITGYGATNMKNYTDSLRQYLEDGGRIWVDNAANNSSVLALTNFVWNISFSSTEQVNSLKGRGPSHVTAFNYFERLYKMKEEGTYLVGDKDVNPRIRFHSGESSDGWTPLIRYGNMQHSIMFRKSFSKGQMIVSNCSMSSGILHENRNGSLSTKLAINILLSIAENKWVSTPWLYEYVYHRDNLFKEEYLQNNQIVYYDDKSDINPNEVVAKKVISKTVSEALLPYIPASYQNATGQYSVEVLSGSRKDVKNDNFEVGHATQNQWSVPTSNAIEGWSVDMFGEGLAEHVVDVAQRGVKSIKVKGTAEGGSHVFWSQRQILSEPGTYELSGWLKTLDVVGAAIAVYSSGELLAISQILTGTQDWAKVTTSFSISSQREVEFRIGFVNGKSTGEAWCDNVSLWKKGNVHMNPQGNGKQRLYAFTTKQNRNGFNFRSEGFERSNITTYDRYIEAVVSIKPFVYRWSNEENRYEKHYDDFATKGNRVKVRQSQGVVTLGTVAELLPELKSGAEWADRNKVFFELLIGPASDKDKQARSENKDYLFLNAGFYDTQGGRFCRIKEGKHVIAYTDIFRADSERSENRHTVQLWTNYSTIRATKRRYSILVDGQNKVQLAYPSTIDNRDNWYLRIRNGNFTMRKIDYDRYIKHYRGKEFYSTSDYWEPCKYSLPEFNKQVFTPSKGLKKVKEEICEYIDDKTLRLQNSPLYVKIGEYKRDPANKVLDTQYEDGRSRYYKIPADDVRKDKPVEVYVKNAGSVDFIQFFDHFDIDYSNGLVIFEEGINAEVEVSYTCDNLEIFRRRYQNRQIVEERLQTSDYKTFRSVHKNWMSSPVPKVYTRVGVKNEMTQIPNTEYEMNYREGVIRFYEEKTSPIYVTYTYALHEKLAIRDYDVRNGLIYLEGSVTFKDDIFANYYYEEEYVEYRGYLDEESRRFVWLDLNPSEGHFCTMREVKQDNKLGAIVTFSDVPTSKLMNKEVYIYLLPHIQGDRINQHCIRHCFSKKEWDYITKTIPTALLLGTIHIREHATVEDITVMDARTRGGGLRKEITKQEIRKKSPVSESYWDIGPYDGMAYYANGVLIIQLPRSILKREGGQFTEKEVNDIVKKYVAYGIYYDIEYV